MEFSESRFFRAQFFLSLGFSGSRFFRIQVFQGPGFSGSKFFRVQVFQGPGFSGSGSGVWVQGLGPGFRSNHCIIISLIKLSQTLSSQTCFLIPYLFHVFQDSCISGSTFFRLQVFLGPFFSGSRFSGSRFFKVQVFQGPSFSRSRYFRVRVQGPGTGFRSSLEKQLFMAASNLIYFSS